MYVALMAVGVVTAVVGLAALGYGIPNYEFSLGSTFIVAGITAFVGGFIVIGLAAAVAQLRRVVTLLSSDPPTRLGRGGESPEPIAPIVSAGSRGGTGPGRASMPPRPQGGEGRAPPRAFAPRLAATASTDAAPEVQLERPRPSTELPLGVERPRPRMAPIVQIEPKFEPQFEPLLMDETEEVTLSPGAVVPPRRSAAFGSEPPVRPVVERKLSTLMWGPKLRPAPIEPADPEPDEPPLALGEEALPGAPEPRVIRGAFAARGAGDVRPVSILKSGVVDGMAYTLYNDGSIEAELPEGTMRFTSLSGLREHLEQYS
ncbi:MAG: hypothetical protein ACLPKB_16585 [Xanthobacteraceae bacterium]